MYTLIIFVFVFFLVQGSGSLTAPSPTVNTRDAMQAIYGMFNQTMENAPFQQHEQMNDSEANLEDEFAATSDSSKVFFSKMVFLNL